MPTISSSFFQPVRDSGHGVRRPEHGSGRGRTSARRSSLARFRVSVPSSSEASISGIRPTSSEPLGPLTLTTPCPTWTSTPPGTWIGFFRSVTCGSLPTRPRTGSRRRPTGLRACSSVSTPRLVEITATPRPLWTLVISLDALEHPPAGPGDAVQAVNGGLTVVGVLQVDPDRALRTLLEQLEGPDEALLLEDLGNLELHLGRGHVGAIVTHQRGVPDSRQQVGNRVGHAHRNLTNSPL